MAIPIPPSLFLLLLSRSTRFRDEVLRWTGVLARTERVLICSLVLVVASDAAEAVQKQFDISADRAEVALKQFAAQANLEVLLATDIVVGVRTNSIKGEFYPLDAVNRMLANTKLIANQVERTGAIVVGKKEPASAQDNASGDNANAGTASSLKKKVRKPAVQSPP